MAMPYLPKREIWVDYTFFRQNTNRLQALSDAGVQCIAKKHDTYNAISSIKQYGATRDEYFGDQMIEKNQLFMGPMGLSGLFALSLAVAEKYDAIYLLGYDFGTKSLADANTHFYQDDKLDIQSSGIRNPAVYLENNNNVKKDHRLFDHYLTSSSKIYNVSPNSNIQSFKKIDYPTFFDYIAMDNIIDLVQKS